MSTKVLRPVVLLVGVMAMVLFSFVTAGGQTCPPNVVVACGWQAGDVPGDVNRDGIVNPLDVSYLVQYLTNRILPPSLFAANVNGYCNPQWANTTLNFDCQPTWGDLVTLVYSVYQSMGTLHDCTFDLQIPNLDIKIGEPRSMFFPVPAAGNTATFWILNDSNQPHTDLLGFSMPIKIIAVNGAVINPASVSLNIHNHGWVNAQWWEVTPVPPAPNELWYMVEAYIAPGDPGVVLDPWGGIPVVTITYDVTSRGTVIFDEYVLPPGDVSVVYEGEYFMTTGPSDFVAVKETSVERRKHPESHEVPVTSLAGLIILLVMLGATGIFAAAWLHR